VQDASAPPDLSARSKSAIHSRYEEKVTLHLALCS
jgi:hypothetical protein